MADDELRRVRVAAFEKRLGSDDSLPATLRSRARSTAGGGEFVEHHVFADDLEALRELSLDPRSCTKVDGYWRVNGDVYFVELEADPSRAPLRATLSLAASRHPESSLRVLRVVFAAAVVQSWWLQLVLDGALPWLSCELDGLEPKRVEWLVEGDAGGASDLEQARGADEDDPMRPLRVRRFMSRTEYEQLSRVGVRFDPSVGAAIAATTVDFTPEDQETARRLLGAHQPELQVDMLLTAARRGASRMTRSHVLELTLRCDFESSSVVAVRAVPSSSRELPIGQGVAERARRFEHRLTRDPSTPIVPRARSTAGGGEFVEHHVFADDLDALRELSLDPRSCTRVDGYWRVNGDVYFVELEADPSRPPLRATLSLAASRHPESSLRVVRVVFAAVVVESWWLQIVLGRVLPWLDGRDGRFEV